MYVKIHGKAPTDLCSRDQRGGRVYSEIFAKGTEPKDKCDIHISVEVCKVSGLLASGNCAPEDKERRVFIKQDASGTEDGKYRAPTAVCTQCKDKKDEKKRKKWFFGFFAGFVALIIGFCGVVFFIYKKDL